MSKNSCTRPNYAWQKVGGADVIYEDGNPLTAADVVRLLNANEQILTDRQKVLNAIPECPEHGPDCVSHALERKKPRFLKNLTEEQFRYSLERLAEPLANENLSKDMRTGYKGAMDKALNLYVERDCEELVCEYIPHHRNPHNEPSR
ncbi:hypothetical protein [Marinobacterium jannaschii]|uniref:hypothetical protein n=1 Tax=Marinobacterium jannaschii TaxID=64970 RepID=UPI0012EB80F3|nr:hypothetical protein [Marinobacterium jannaschii]